MAPHGTTPFPVGAICRDVLSREVRRDRPGMFAVCCPLEAPLLPGDQPVLAHPLPGRRMRGLPQVPFDRANTVRMWARWTMSRCWRRQAGRPGRAKNPLWLISRIRHMRLSGRWPFPPPLSGHSFGMPCRAVDEAEGHRLASFAKKASPLSLDPMARQWRLFSGCRAPTSELRSHSATVSGRHADRPEPQPAHRYPARN